MRGRGYCAATMFDKGRQMPRHFRYDNTDSSEYVSDDGFYGNTHDGRTAIDVSWFEFGPFKTLYAERNDWNDSTDWSPYGNTIGFQEDSVQGSWSMIPSWGSLVPTQQVDLHLLNNDESTFYAGDGSITYTWTNAELNLHGSEKPAEQVDGGDGQLITDEFDLELLVHSGSRTEYPDGGIFKYSKVEDLKIDTEVTFADGGSPFPDFLNLAVGIFSDPTYAATPYGLEQMLGDSGVFAGLALDFVRGPSGYYIDGGKG